MLTVCVGSDSCFRSQGRKETGRLVSAESRKDILDGTLLCSIAMALEGMEDGLSSIRTRPQSKVRSARSADHFIFARERQLVIAK